MLRSTSCSARASTRSGAASRGWTRPSSPRRIDSPRRSAVVRTAIYCAQQDIGRLAIGPLAGNPFPDATPAFFEAMARALSLGLDHAIDIVAPFAELEKSAVIRLGIDLGVPLDLTLSCMNPRQGRHCGQCSKCRERRDAFREAGVADPTEYAIPPVR